MPIVMEAVVPTNTQRIAELEKAVARLLTQVETHDGFLTSLRALVRDVDAVIVDSLDEL